ncbi:MAG: DUF1549 and DUF1553 domain-containing protein, partial [Planctomycetaceae bacterium]
DPRPDAYERLVDRLLASPAFGEHWARMWLDLARYADSAGFADDPPRTIWAYRDYVIRSFNENKPFDQFTIEQIAGDLLPKERMKDEGGRMKADDASKQDVHPSSFNLHPLQRLIATAFHRNTLTNNEGGTSDEEFRNAAIVDRVNTTMAVWMGTTIMCAQCHDHKYDPISQAEYFQFFAFFNNTADADRKDETPVLEIFTEEQKRQRAEWQAEIMALEQSLAGNPADRKPQEDRLAALKKQLDELKPHTTVPVLRELPLDERRTTRIQRRGNYLDVGEEATAGVPAALHPLPENAPRDRLALARWLVDEENPLTARVVVNRYWEQLFGTGIVRTSEEFGSQGELPSHPELLDWLAVELASAESKVLSAEADERRETRDERSETRSKLSAQHLALSTQHSPTWDIKRLLRLLVTSATYRQNAAFGVRSVEFDSSTPHSALRTPHLVDPDNRLLARGPRFRLSAEMVRDQALFAAGLLSQKMYGPSVHPPRPTLNLKAAFGGSTDWTTSPGGDRYRRGLYTEWRRSLPYPSMATFDAPSREVCTVRRVRTNTPLQALVTLNDPVYVEAAQALARRMATSGKTPEEKVTIGFRLCLAREPHPAEVERLVTLHKQVYAEYANQPDQARALATDPLGPAPDGMDVIDLAAWTVVGNVLLNLDEVLMKR